MKKYLFVLLALSLGIGVVVSAAIAVPADKTDLGIETQNGQTENGNGPAPKVDVCHMEGNGSWHLNNVSKNALQAHLDHGDAQPGDMVPGMQGKKFDENCVIEDAGPTVTEGPANFAGDDQGAVRYKGRNTGGEVFLGKVDLGVGGNRVESEFGGWVNDREYTVTFKHDGSGNLAATIDDPTTQTDPDVSLARTVTPCATWDTMQIFLRASKTAGDSATFQNVELEGNPIGSFGPQNAGMSWTVTDYDFSGAWMLEGTLVTTGWGAATNPNENNKLEIIVGCAA